MKLSVASTGLMTHEGITRSEMWRHVVRVAQLVGTSSLDTLWLSAHRTEAHAWHHQDDIVRLCLQDSAANIGTAGILVNARETDEVISTFSNIKHRYGERFKPGITSSSGGFDPIEKEYASVAHRLQHVFKNLHMFGGHHNARIAGKLSLPYGYSLYTREWHTLLDPAKDHTGYFKGLYVDESGAFWRVDGDKYEREMNPYGTFALAAPVRSMPPPHKILFISAGSLILPGLNPPVIHSNNASQIIDRCIEAANRFGVQEVALCVRAVTLNEEFELLHAIADNFTQRAQI